MSNQQLTTRVTGASSEVGRATGFELASRGQPNAANIESALERNRAFAAAGGHEGAVGVPNLRVFVITCLDPRVDPAHFLGLGLSDAMVVRNVGGRVTPEVINTPSSIPWQPSRATSSASAPHPRSPRASPCPGTSTTWSPAWCGRSSPPAAASDHAAVHRRRDPDRVADRRGHAGHRVSSDRRRPAVGDHLPRDRPCSPSPRDTGARPGRGGDAQSRNAGGDVR